MGLLRQLVDASRRTGLAARTATKLRRTRRLFKVFMMRKKLDSPVFNFTRGWITRVAEFVDADMLKVYEYTAGVFIYTFGAGEEVDFIVTMTSSQILP